MVHYLGYPTSKTAMLFCVSHYWIRLLKQLYLLACDFNFRGARCFVWLTLFIAQGSMYISHNCCCHGVLFCCYCHACICYVGTYTHVHFFFSFHFCLGVWWFSLRASPHLLASTFGWVMLRNICYTCAHI